MTSKIYAVYDSKVGAYLAPFVLRSRGEALRGWQTAVQDPKTNFNRYPSDYCLFELGEFDEFKGLLIPHQSPISLGLAQEFVSADLKVV